MNRFFIVFFCWVLGCSMLSAQKVTGLLTTIDGEPLVGANVVWQDTEVGTSTDKDGKFKLSAKGITNRTLVFSYVGYKTETLAIGERLHWEIQLLEDLTLDQVVVTSNSKATRFADAPAKIEVIGTREIERAACCSMAGCFNTNASVESATTNVITDSKELRILGLSGVYNQILFDGMPLIQGTSYTYGTGSFPGTLIENIFVAKGANSVLQGFESISGQINVIPHSPANAPRLFLNAYVNTFGESQYNANYLVKKKAWSNFTAAHLTLPVGLLDRDGDGFRDIVQTERFSLFNKWVYDNPDKDKFKTQIGLRLWKEKREGGQMEFDRATDLGSNSVYGQTVDLIQFDAYVKMNYQLTNDLALTWLNSAFAHEQESYFGLKKYAAEQFNFTSSLMADYFYGDADHNLKAGASLRSNRLEERIDFVEDISFLDYDGRYRNNYNIPGFFAENTLNLAPFTIITGLRVDHHGEFGWKTTPRFLVRAALEQNWDFRFSIGKGFRRVHLFSERINLLASNRQLFIDTDLAPEEALNTGLNVVKKVLLDNIDITFSADAYYTVFQNQVFPDFNRNPATAYVENFTGKSVSQSLQFENKWEFFGRVDFKWAYNYHYVYQVLGEQKVLLPFVPQHKALANASYSTESDRWQFDLTYRWVGEKQLPFTTGYPAEYQIADRSESYGTLDFQLTKRWEKLELYTGVENIFDFRQTFPILASDDPFGPYFDPAFNWGPTKGREIYLGIRYKIP